MPIVPYPPLYAKRYPDGRKTCANCKAIKPFDEFHQILSGRDAGRLRSDCIKCRRAKGLDYKARNSEKCKAAAKTYYANNKEAHVTGVMKCRRAKPEHYRAMNAAWQKANKDKRNPCRRRHYAKHRERFAAKWKAYYQEHSHERILLARKSPRKFDPALDTLTGPEWVEIIGAQGGCCAKCRGQFGQSLPPTRDHILPLSKGGRLTRENTQALCHRCNCSKHTKIVDYRVAI